MASMKAKRKAPRRGLGYSVEEIIRASGVRYRAYVWNAVAKKKEPVSAPDGSKTFDNFAAADAAGRVARQQMDGTYEGAGIPVTRQTHRYTFGEVCDLWIPTQGGTKRSRDQRRWSVNALKKAFDSRMFDELTEDDFRAWDAGEQERGMSKNTRQQRIVYLRQTVAYGQKRGFRPDNPAADLYVKTERQREPRYLTDQELLFLLCFLPTWFWPAVLLAFDCGLRAAEVAGLRWGRLDLNSDDPHVLVSDVIEPDRTLRSFPKGSKAEKVALTPRVVTALRVLRRMRPTDTEHDHVFRNSRNKPLLPSYPNRLLRAAFEASGLPGDRPVFHHLRHSCGTRLADADAPATVIQAVLRHANLATSQRYIREVGTTKQRAWMARVQQGGTRGLAPVVPLTANTVDRTIVDGEAVDRQVS